MFFAKRHMDVACSVFIMAYNLLHRAISNLIKTITPPFQDVNQSNEPINIFGVTALHFKMLSFVTQKTNTTQRLQL